MNAINWLGTWNEPQVAPELRLSFLGFTDDADGGSRMSM